MQLLEKYDNFVKILIILLHCAKVKKGRRNMNTVRQDETEDDFEIFNLDTSVSSSFMNGKKDTGIIKSIILHVEKQ